MTPGSPSQELEPPDSPGRFTDHDGGDCPLRLRTVRPKSTVPAATANAREMPELNNVIRPCLRVVGVVARSSSKARCGSVAGTERRCHGIRLSRRRPDIRPTLIV